MCSTCERWRTRKSYNGNEKEKSSKKKKESMRKFEEEERKRLSGKRSEKTFDANPAEDKSQEGSAKERKRKRFLLNGEDYTAKDTCHRKERISKIVSGDRVLVVAGIEKVYLKSCMADK